MSDYSDFVERFGGLCEELDTRKVEWDVTSRNTIEWRDARDSLVLATKDSGSNLLYVRAWMTQEQAIEATLEMGRGMCRVECYHIDIMDGERSYWCSACHSEEIRHTHSYCPNCGAKVIDAEENA